MKNLYRIVWLVFFTVFSLLTSSRGEAAEKQIAAAADIHGALELSNDWVKRQAPYQGVALSYAYAGSYAAVDMVVRPIAGVTQTAELSWQSLFEPQFSSIQMRTEGRANVRGVQGKYCIYTIREGILKQALEKLFPMKYLNYVFIEGGRLYSVTFSDRDVDFDGHLMIFRQAIQNLHFEQLPAMRTKS